MSLVKDIFLDDDDVVSLSKISGATQQSVPISVTLIEKCPVALTGLLSPKSAHFIVITILSSPSLAIILKSTL